MHVLLIYLNQCYELHKHCSVTNFLHTYAKARTNRSKSQNIYLGEEILRTVLRLIDMYLNIRCVIFFRSLLNMM